MRLPPPTENRKFSQQENASLIFPVFNGILYALAIGCSWHDVPAKYGIKPTVRWYLALVPGYANVPFPQHPLGVAGWQPPAGQESRRSVPYRFERHLHPLYNLGDDLGRVYVQFLHLGRGCRVLLYVSGGLPEGARDACNDSLSSDLKLGVALARPELLGRHSCNNHSNRRAERSLGR